MNLGGPQQRWICVVRLLFCVKTHVKREYSAIFIICHMYVTIFLLVKSSGFRLLWTVAFLFLFLEQANVSSLWISLHYHLLNKSTHKSNFYVCVYTVYWSNIAVYPLHVQSKSQCTVDWWHRNIAIYVTFSISWAVFSSSVGTWNNLMWLLTETLNSLMSLNSR